MAPWSAFWDRNVFAGTAGLASLLANPFVRGAVSGVGVITAVAGLAELVAAFRRRQPDDTPSEVPPAS